MEQLDLNSLCVIFLTSGVIEGIFSPRHTVLASSLAFSEQTCLAPEYYAVTEHLLQPQTCVHVTGGPLSCLHPAGALHNTTTGYTAS